MRAEVPVSVASVLPVPLDRPSRRKPDWLRVRPPGGANYARLKEIVRGRDLHTVCEEAHCPNLGECWQGGTATFMVLGDACTRGCSFCAVTSGNPGGRIDSREPTRLAEAVAAMGLDYVVLTMVDRDDLPDGGAGHVASCIAAIKDRHPQLLVEALVGDFRGELEAVDRVCNAGPEVLAHNVETVERLQRRVRDRRAGFRQSLRVLARAKAHRLSPYTKSSIMLGLGEKEDEVLSTMWDLRQRGVDFLTLGQYLQPTRRHLEVQEYVSPARFDRLRRRAESLGFLYVASGPLVRSSYRAGEFFVRSLLLTGGR
ncbi:MAG: lipoyl synthase [Acidobacteriota bacterium]